jgi:hypothetical protein
MTYSWVLDDDDERLDRLPPEKRRNRATPCRAKRQTAEEAATSSVMLWR